MKNRFGLAMTMAMALTSMSGPLQAQDAAWPARPVRLVVPSSPDGYTFLVSANPASCRSALRGREAPRIWA